MSAFDLRKSFERARRRLGEPGSPRSPRSDRGGLRLDPEVVLVVREALSGRERPPMREMLLAIEAGCRERGRVPPSRATVYKLMRTLPGPTFRKGDLPPSVQAALYNLAPESEVPAHQVGFACFNYGDLCALHFAAGLPWLVLYQALRTPGYRRKSRGLAEAVARVRGV
jgi:hypothetical protein